MTLREAMQGIKRGQAYEILTKWMEMPIKTKAVVVSVDLKEWMIGLDLGKCRFRDIFISRDLYFKVSERYYLRCSGLSLEKDTLLIMPKAIEPPPPFISRRFFRIIPPYDEKVYVSICFDENCIIDTIAIDISEGGIGVEVQKDRVPIMVSNLLRQEGSECRPVYVSLHIKLPMEGSLEVDAQIKNITVEGDEIRLGMGFLLKSESQVEPIRKYMLRVQRKMLEQFYT